MTLKDAQKKYSDAVKSELTVTKQVLSTVNVYKQNDLRSYLQKIFKGSSIIYCNCSGRKITVITSEEAYIEELRQLSMIPGTKVKMTGDESRFIENQKEWIVSARPQWMCDSLVVWLEGYSGAYSCEYLEILEEAHPDTKFRKGDRVKILSHNKTLYIGKTGTISEVVPVFNSPKEVEDAGWNKSWAQREKGTKTSGFYHLVVGDKTVSYDASDEDLELEKDSSLAGK